MTEWSSAVVGFAGLTTPHQLVHPDPIEHVFTRAERIRSGAGRTLQHWAGRLAAKYAVLRLLGVDATPDRLSAVEVLPAPTPQCPRTAACLDGHPPGVTLGPALRAMVDDDTVVRVSLSHAAGIAVAVALAAAPLPEDREREGALGWT